MKDEMMSKIMDEVMRKMGGAETAEADCASQAC